MRNAKLAEAIRADMPTLAKKENAKRWWRPLTTEGVPTIAERIPVFEQRERPGNRRMATLGGIYSVDRHVRTGDDILAALFREEQSAPPTRR